MRLDELTTRFLLAVERAELDKVREVLETRQATGFNINCRDPLDRNALIICIDNKDLDVIRLLLNATDLRVSDAMLYAIRENYFEAVELLVDRWRDESSAEEKLHDFHGDDDEEHCFFNRDLTPLMLAAQKNNLEIVKLLLDRNVSPIQDPHDPRCGCTACSLARSHDCLKFSRARINTYRALSSPSLMALSSPDPLKTAFEMSAKLEGLAQLEPEYKEDYMRMRSQCQAFATKLLDYTRTSKELEILLDFNGYDESSSSASLLQDDYDYEGRLEPQCDDEARRQVESENEKKVAHDCERASERVRSSRKRRSRLARLKLAIECKQKTFCAHPNIQELLASLWYENLPGFRQMNVLNQTLQVLCIGLLFPFYSLAYLVAPNSQLGLYIKKPFIKFICHSASYITFITLLVLASQRVEAFYCWSSVMGLFVASNETAAAGTVTVDSSGSDVVVGGGGGGRAPSPSSGVEANFSLFQRPSAQALIGSNLTLHSGEDDNYHDNHNDHNDHNDNNDDDDDEVMMMMRRDGTLSAASRGRLLGHKTASGGSGDLNSHNAGDEFGARGLDSLKKIFDELPASSKKRGALPSPIESIILIWVVSLIWAELKQIRALGMNYYKHDMWNLLDSVASGCYMGTLILRLISYAQSDDTSREVAREEWQAYDPTLLSEGLFATATIFSSLKLVYIFSVNPYLGPLQISLGRMIVDIVRFSWIYMLVLFAFACGMNQLLWYYADLERHHAASLNLDQFDNNKAKHFSNVFESTQTLFWANFGLVDLENFDLAGIRQYTRFWALLMFGSYCFINVIVVLNLLIAMMNHSYVKISTRSDIEWKFARTRLWVSYFENGSTVPAPFNAIPSIKSCKCAITQLLRYLRSRLGARGKEAQPPTRQPGIQLNHHHHHHHHESASATNRHGGGGGGGPAACHVPVPVTYDTVIRSLVRRYLVDEQRKVEKGCALSEAKLERWSRLNVFAS